MNDPYRDLRAVDAPFVTGLAEPGRAGHRGTTASTVRDLTPPVVPLALSAPRRTPLEIMRDVAVTVAAVLLSVVLALVLYVIVRAGAALSEIGNQGPGVVVPSTAPYTCEPAFPGDTTCPK